ncbi:YHS domain-containing (seleno)protein [Salinispirillum marinum]|uniref:YHS domain-containing (Seleno)protein n=2 Tax=Saccharospirillaceae TaxID=255527 RepID=A0ABV8BAS0_9GAMM
MPTTHTRTRTPLLISALLLLFGLPAISSAIEPVYTGFLSSHAIQGYDTVAYFTENQAVKGDPNIASEWNGATWLFSTPEHQALFDANPEAYAPQYGGYCAYAMADGNAVRVDPKAFSIVDGKLYLNFSQSVQTRWENNQSSFITAADQHWPALLNPR